MNENKRNRNLFLLMLPLILLILSCQLVEAVISSSDNNDPGEISGVVVDFYGDLVINRPVELVLVAGDQDASQFVMVDDEKWVKVIGTKFKTKTDKNGEFQFSEVPPREYILLVLTREFHSLKKADGAAIFELSGGEALDVGRVAIWTK
jgi:hypothetical protein